MNTNAKKVLQVTSLLIFFLLVIAYAFFRSSDLIFGIKIKNVALNGETAQSGVTIHENIVKITGNAKNAVNLSIDGREISIDQDGNFNETIALLAGYNILTIIAKDKFGDVDEENYQLMH